MRRIALLVHASIVGLLGGCSLGLPGTPNALARMSPEEITSASPKDLCFAFDLKEEVQVISDEVARRGIQCLPVLQSHGIEATGGALRQRSDFVVSVEPAVVAQAAQREFARMAYTITTSDGANGLVVAERRGTPYELLQEVTCRYNSFSGTVTHRVTVTARAVTGGSSVDVRGNATVVDHQNSNQSCTSSGRAEEAIREAVRSPDMG